MNKKFIIGLFPVLMAFALPSLFLNEKQGTSKGSEELLSQIVAQKLAATLGSLKDESQEVVEDIDPQLQKDLDRLDEQEVSQEMLRQAQEDHGVAPILMYAFHAKKQKFLELINSTAAIELERTRDRSGAGVLHWAVMGNCFECVKGAISKGLDVNSENSRGETPLVFAVSDGDFKMAKYLINQGADPNVVSNNVGFTLLMSASFEGLNDLTALIIKADGNLLAADGEGKTAIHYAAKEGHSEVVSLLLRAFKKKGLNLSTILAKRDSQGKSALDYAADYGHKKVEKVLLRL